MKYIIKKRKSWYALANLFFILLALITALIIIIILIVNRFNSVLELSWLIILLIGFGLYIMNYIFWQFRGYEEVEINEKEFIIRRKGKLINDKFKIPTSTIHSIQEQEYEPITYTTTIFRNPFLFSKAIGETGGRILAKYGETGKYKIDFGLGLTPEEAKLYVQQMNEVLDSLGNNNASTSDGGND